MIRLVLALFLPVITVLASGTPALAQETPPAWAYPVNPPDFKLPPDDGSLRKVPNSNAALTLSQVRDLFYAPDWHPDNHPKMPTVVAIGRKPDVMACGYCHRADGPGGPENASLAGLPESYIKQQVADFKSGARKSSVMNRAPMSLKTRLVGAATDEEIANAAAYFASIKPRSIVKIIESDTVPKSFVTGWFLAADKTAGTEPPGDRIIEVPDDLERYVSRDAQATFIAYVPVGSIQKGRELAAGTNGTKTVQCGTCHGPDLKGIGPIPGFAGRSPSYIFRQLFDFKHGARMGLGSEQMKAATEKLTINDMIALAAYAASLTP
jgi:cytochrome c553